MGISELDGSAEFELLPDEVITNVSVRNGWVVDGINFTFNTGRELKIGGTGGNYRALIQYDCIIIGTFGTYGDHLRGIGFYYVHKKDYFKNIFFNKRLAYLVIRNRLKDKEILANFIANFIRKFSKNKKEYFPELALGQLCLLHKHLFSNVISYI